MPSPGTQRHSAPVHDEIRQAVVHGHIDRLGISGGMAEGLQHQIGGESQTGQIFQFVAGHGAQWYLVNPLWSYTVRSKYSAVHPPHRTPCQPFFAPSVKPLVLAATSPARLKTVDAAKPKNLRARSVKPRPMINGIRPPAADFIQQHIGF